LSISLLWPLWESENAPIGFHAGQVFIRKRLRVRIAQSRSRDFRVFGVSRNDDVAFMLQHIFLASLLFTFRKLIIRREWSARSLLRLEFRHIIEQAFDRRVDDLPALFDRGQ
jgi:hypothetical protein